MLPDAVSKRVRILGLHKLRADISCKTRSLRCRTEGNDRRGKEAELGKSVIASQPAAQDVRGVMFYIRNASVLHKDSRRAALS